jgi:hypothetical protein
MNGRGRALLVLGVLVLGCGSIGPIRDATLPPVVATIAHGVTPRLAAADAVRITLDYLGNMDAEAEGPRIPAVVDHAWAVRADDAPALDGCIPAGMGGGLVWITHGTGAYLNLRDLAWSRSSSAGADLAGLAANCAGPGPAGIIAIDDATGTILGVYPLAGPDYPHPTAAPPG